MTLTKMFKKLEKNIVQAIENSLEENLITIAEQSLKEAPKDTGDMRKSMRIINGEQEVGKGNDNGSVQMGILKLNKNKKNDLYISYDTEYAIYQHEIKHQNYTTPGTKSKFLEDPFNRNIRPLQKDLGKSIQKALKKK